MDITETPELKEWADKAAELCREWWPLLCRFLATDSLTPPEEVKLIFKKQHDVPGSASGGEITISGEWVSRHPEDFGMIIHELTHIVQSYPGHPNNPGWLVEGIADYIRNWRYEPEAPRRRIDPAKASYRDAYQTTAAFLAWASAKYDRRLVPWLDRSLRDGSYSSELWTRYTGKDVDTLWGEFIGTLR